MKATIESTPDLVKINGQPVRRWQGKTEKGVPFHCFVAGLAVEDNLDLSEFKDLLEMPVTEPMQRGLRDLSNLQN